MRGLGGNRQRFRPWTGLALAGALLGALAACASTAAPKARTAKATPPPPPLVSPVEVDKFDGFLRDFRVQALAAGIKPDTYDTAMAGLKLLPRVETLNQEQPEFSRPVWAYLDTAVSDRRIANGKTHLGDNLTALANIEIKYGVPKEILVAIWGIETDYGRDSGSFNMFGALATLGYDGSRAAFARTELLAALKILEQEHYTPNQMTSSWAGAFGQTQFEPSGFLKWAIDGDGDGKVDLWNSVADSLASTANDLNQEGWAKGRPWGYEISLPANFPYDQADVDVAKSIADWRALGVKTVAGAALPDAPEQPAIYLPAGAHGPAFLVFPNFKVILKYNNAASYALAVALLGDRIGGAGQVAGSWPRDEKPMSREDRFAVQNGLKTLGFDPGPIDGVLGRQVRAATRAWQKARGLPADGYVNSDVVQQLRTEVEAKR